MYAFLVLVILALGLTVIVQALDELLPVSAPAAWRHTIAVAIGAGLAWMLDYSAFAAFGQDLRAEWMHPVLTGLVLVAIGELVRGILDAVAHRPEEPRSEAVPSGRPARAA